MPRNPILTRGLKEAIVCQPLRCQKVISLSTLSGIQVNRKSKWKRECVRVCEKQFCFEERMHLQVMHDTECQRNKQGPASFLLGSSHACTHTQSYTPPIWPCLGGCGGRPEPTCLPRVGTLWAMAPLLILHIYTLPFWIIERAVSPI